MSNKQTTAVEWLIKKLTNRQNGVFDGLPHLSLDEIYAEAKTIERKQIEDSYKEASCNILGEEVCPIDECNAAWEYFEGIYTQ